MFERFIYSARNAVVKAQEEARQFNHNYIGTEHLLLGILVAGDSVGFQVLENLGLDADKVRTKIEEINGRGEQPPLGHILFTPNTKIVLELALKEALQLGHNCIGTEHLLLGMLRGDEGTAVTILMDGYIDRGAIGEIRRQVIQAHQVADVSWVENDEARKIAQDTASALDKDIASAHAELIDDVVDLSAFLHNEGVKLTPGLLAGLINWKKGSR